MRTVRKRILLVMVTVSLLASTAALQASNPASDPGVRGGPDGAGGMLAGLTGSQPAFFAAGQTEFEEPDGVGDGLGPRFNLDSCAGCHTQPATGGTSPAVNPQVAAATAFGAQNVVPSFITLHGPIREARFQRNADGTRDGGVHALFVIRGRVDSTGNATGCTAVQENFAAQVAHDNVVFRIPTPTFGAGLIEMIPDATIVANQAAHSGAKAALGISGRPNHNGNDGTIARFGWKAQNKSLLLFSGEAYNVEMGITNELFQTERDENPTCQFAAVPNNVTNTDGGIGVATISAIEKFSFFMRFLAAPTPSPTTPGGAASIAAGRQKFSDIGCALCHTPMLLTTGNTTVTALANAQANLFSDLLLHQMGPGLADDIKQGQASGDEFRTAPLWGLGKRIFFLHDGRTTDLKQAIREHRSFGNFQFGPSEANKVVDNFNDLTETQKQNVLNFLRSL
jgi:CxxC motif-containing protein (DUF1111 family)